MLRSHVFLTVALALSFSITAAKADEHKGPNGGLLYEGAEHKYHVELKIDPTTKSATAFVLDNKAKKGVPIKAATIKVKVKGLKEPITLKAAPAKEGDTTFTQYKGTHDRFGEKLDHDDVEIVAVIKEGQPAVTFKPED
jgi:hypothetical protein